MNDLERIIFEYVCYESGVIDTLDVPKIAQAITDAGYVKMSEIRVDEEAIQEVIDGIAYHNFAKSPPTTGLAKAISQNITSLIRGKDEKENSKTTF